MSRRERVKPVSKFFIYFEVCNLVGRSWEIQEGLAVEPLLVGCGLKAHDLKRLEYQPKQINHGCPVKIVRLRNTDSYLLGVLVHMRSMSNFNHIDDKHIIFYLVNNSV